MSDETTTIQVSRKLRVSLAKLGSKDDTFETIIQGLLDKAGSKS